MAAIHSHPSAWSIHGTLAELKSGRLAARVDVTRPDLGAQQLQLAGITLAGPLLALEPGEETAHVTQAWPLAVADVYARRDDLIASYTPRDDWPFAPQIYWRAASLESSGALGSLELLVSVQTNLLDTRPRIHIRSRLEASEALLIEPRPDQEAVITELGRPGHTFSPTAPASVVVVRIAAANLSYLEIMPASDFQEAGVRWVDDIVCDTRWNLFADFLEKGVIWRARLNSAFVPRENDVELATAICRAVDERPLPLTV